MPSPYGKLVLFGLALLFVAMALGAESGGEDTLAPQSKKRRRKSKTDRGLPDEKTLRELAWTYLETQHRLWPKLATQGILPPLTKEVAAQLAQEFRARFLGETPLTAIAPSNSSLWELIAAVYLRYSSDKSNPRSLAQQLVNALEKAHSNGHFIPWAYVFADAAVTGTTAHRHGYDMAKAAVGAVELEIQVLYFDEVGRASRDTIESLTLGKFIDQHKKRLIGVSDGFDSDSEMSKFILSIFAALQEWFIDQLRSKVKRGRRDALDRDTNLRPPAFGQKLVPAVDSEGRPICGKDGEPLKRKVKDKKTARYVKEAFELYGEKNWSKGKIARHFNDLGVGDIEWDGKEVNRILRRRSYVGIVIEGMTYLDIDPQTKGLVTRHRPRKDWQVRRRRHLQIVPWSLWKKVQKRLAETKEAYAGSGKGKKRRTDLYPTTLVRPICGCCEKEMWLGRGGRNPSFKCLNGRDGKRGCTARGYKSVRIVEEAIMRPIQQTVFTEERIERLVISANSYLKEEAAKPRTDVAPLEAQVKEVRAKRDRLKTILESEGEQDLGSLVSALRGHERRLRELNERVREANSQNFVPPPIPRENVERILQDLRGLLNMDVAIAAPIIKKLTGPVVVHQVYEEGKKRPTWYAEFTVNLVPAVVELAKRNKYPSSGTWEHLSSRSWTFTEHFKFAIRRMPKYQKLAHSFKELYEQGQSITAIAKAHNRTRNYVSWLIRYARTGQKPW